MFVWVRASSVWNWATAGFSWTSFSRMARARSLASSAFAGRPVRRRRKALLL
jgi:hypothetical protein